MAAPMALPPALVAPRQFFFAQPPCPRRRRRPKPPPCTRRVLTLHRQPPAQAAPRPPDNPSECRRKCDIPSWPPPTPSTASLPPPRESRAVLVAGPFSSGRPSRDRRGRPSTPALPRAPSFRTRHAQGTASQAPPSPSPAATRALAPSRTRHAQGTSRPPRTASRSCVPCTYRVPTPRRRPPRRPTPIASLLEPSPSSADEQPPPQAGVPFPPTLPPATGPCPPRVATWPSPSGALRRPTPSPPASQGSPDPFASRRAPPPRPPPKIRSRGAPYPAAAGYEPRRGLARAPHLYAYPAPAAARERTGREPGRRTSRVFPARLPCTNRVRAGTKAGRRPCSAKHQHIRAYPAPRRRQTRARSPRPQPSRSPLPRPAVPRRTVGEIEAKDGLPSADRNNKATLLLTGPFRTAKSSAKDLTPLVLKLQYAKYRGHTSVTEEESPAKTLSRSLFLSICTCGWYHRVLAWILT